jgi:hypothetical protein
VEAKLIGHQPDPPFFPDHANQFVNAVKVVGQRFFHEKVTPRGGSAQSHADVKAAGVTDENRGRPYGKRLVQIPVDVDVILIFEVDVRFYFQLVGHRLRQPPGAVGVDFDALLQKRPQVANVPLTDPAQADEKYFHEGSCFP